MFSVVTEVAATRLVDGDEFNEKGWTPTVILSAVAPVDYVMVAELNRVEHR